MKSRVRTAGVRTYETGSELRFMKLIPTTVQWRRWKLLSRVTYIGGCCTLAALLVAVIVQVPTCIWQGDVTDRLDRIEQRLESSPHLGCGNPAFEEFESKLLDSLQSTRSSRSMRESALAYAEHKYEQALTHLEYARLELSDDTLAIAKTWAFSALDNLALGKPESALVDLDSAIRIAPALADVHLFRGEVLNGVGRYTEAEKDFGIGMAIRPNNPLAYASFAMTLSGLGRHDEAIAACDTALMLKPDLVVALNNRSVAYRNKGRLNESLADTKAVLELVPDYACAWYNQALVFSDQREHKRAISRYNRALSYSPCFVEAWFNRALEFAALRQQDSAEASYRRAIDCDPKFVKALLNLGNMAFESGEIVEATDLYRRAVEADSTYADSWFSLGSVQVQAGRDKEAVESYKVGLRLNRNNPRAWLAMGLAHRHLGELEIADACLDTANLILKKLR
ncbi:MAG: tetratricopeptide repeat protein [bacterium]